LFIFSSKHRAHGILKLTGQSWNEGSIHCIRLLSASSTQQVEVAAGQKQKFSKNHPKWHFLEIFSPLGVLSLFKNVQYSNSPSLKKLKKKSYFFLLKNSDQTEHNTNFF